jgi:hypothetical protein
MAGFLPCKVDLPKHQNHFGPRKLGEKKTSIFTMNLCMQQLRQNFAVVRVCDLELADFKENR